MSNKQKYKMRVQSVSAWSQLKEKILDIVQFNRDLYLEENQAKRIFLNSTLQPFKY